MLKRRFENGGLWGDCLWTIKNGILTIERGVGESLAVPGGCPWKDYASEISVVWFSGAVKLPAGASLKGMFAECSNLKHADLEHLDTSQVVDMTSMFEGCEKLRSICTIGIDTGSTVLMNRMFAGCKELMELDVQGFDVSRVREMNGMFERCERIKKIDVSNWDIASLKLSSGMFLNCSELREFVFPGNHNSGTANPSKLIDISWMFVGCTSLNTVDFSNIDFCELRNINSLFKGCVSLKKIISTGSHLKSLETAENAFKGCRTLKCADISGTGINESTLAINIYEECTAIASIRTKGSYNFFRKEDGWDRAEDGTYFRPGVVFDITYFPNGGSGVPVRDAVMAENTISVKDNVFPPPGEYIFKEWNTRKDGKGESYSSGDEILPVYSDRYLYAIWGGQPEIRDFEIPDTISYGEKIVLLDKEILENNGNIESLVMEISRDGMNDWKQLSAEAILPVSMSGYFVRLCAKNSMGTGYSKKKQIRIKKADYDVSNLKWRFSGKLTYDGSEKKVELINVPQGLSVKYDDNTGINAGTYTTKAALEFDEANYNPPPKTPELKWQIQKAQMDLSNVRWKQMSDNEYIYDGTEKTVVLEGLSKDVIPEYKGNTGINAGTYVASVVLRYDEKNYFHGAEIQPLRWEIKRASLDMADVRWNYDGKPIKYNEKIQEIELLNIPSGVKVDYAGNRAIRVGEYKAYAVFSVNDEMNYELPESMNCTWKIAKGELDFSRVQWNYRESFVYDGLEKRVFLTGLPEKVSADYSNNVAREPGTYLARAEFNYDRDNYDEPEIMECTWCIDRKKIATDNIKWDYAGPFDYDGAEHRVLLTGLSDDMEIEYFGNRAENAGQYVASARLIADEDRYEKGEIKDLTWTIRKAEADMSDVAWDYFEPYVYDEMPKSIVLHNVPPGLNVIYENNRQKNAGDYVASASFSPETPGNMVVPEPMHIKWRIEKAVCSTEGISWNYMTSNIYDGTEKRVELAEIPKGYTATYINNTAIDAGEYIADAKLVPDDKDNYREIQVDSFSWKIEKTEFDITDVCWSGDLDTAFDGGEKSVELENVPEGLTVHYRNNSASKVGDYIAEAEFESRYKNYYTPDSVSVKWSIRKAELNIEELKWNYSAPFEYSGELCRIELENLPDNVSVRYSTNEAVNAGVYIAEAVVIPDEKNSYYVPERIRCKWEIKKKEFDTSKIRWNYIKPYIYNENPFTVKLEQLPEGLSAKYEGNVQLDAGHYTARAEFYTEDRNNYVVPDMMTCDWIISKADCDMSSIIWTDYEDFVYDGEQKSVRLHNVPSQLRVIYQDNIAVNAGTYRAKAGFSLIEEGNYNIPEPMECDWKIKKAEIDTSGCYWVETEVKSGSEEPYKIFLTDVPGTVNVKYEGNIHKMPGSYVVRAEFFAYDTVNYVNPDPIVKKWVIDKLSFDMSSVQWDYQRDSFTFDGEKKEVALAGLPEGLRVKYTDNQGVDAGNYLARADFYPENPEEYMAPSPMECEWQIAKKTIDMKAVRWDAGKVFTYDGTEKCVELINLPEEVTPVYENNTAVNAGDYLASVTFRVDIKNYEIPEFVEFPWKIYKATIDISGLKWSMDRDFVFDGTEKSIALEGVPQGMKIEYGGNSYTDAGRYTATAEVIPESTENYYRPMVQSCKWEIKKADYDLSRVRWQDETVFTYDGTAKTVVLKNYPENIRPHYYGNKKTNAGAYSASVVFEYDVKNYNRPEVSGLLWKIEKGKFNLKDVKWSSQDSFEYDGKEKSVFIEGLPPGLGVEYYGNYATDAGEYTAQAILKYDSFNYERPYVGTHIWRINKAIIDLGDLEWNYSEPFVYDGTEKSVELEGVISGKGLLNRIEINEPPVIHHLLPRGSSVEYECNSAINSGEYNAIARIIPPDYDNYEQPETLEIKWTIEKAVYNGESLVWDYSVPFIYDGKEKKVELKNLPEGVKEVKYSGNQALETGSYNARASFVMDESSNYLPPEDQTLSWKISKRILDLSEVRWDYKEPFVYDGTEKTVQVTGLPDEVTVTYFNNSHTEKGVYTAVAKPVYDKECYIVPDIEELRWYIL